MPQHNRKLKRIAGTGVAMVIAHLIVGLASGIATAAAMLVAGYPVWAAVLGYGVAGGVFTLLSAFIVFVNSELPARDKRRMAHTAADAVAAKS